jgi:exocyst complex component 4
MCKLGLKFTRRFLKTLCLVPRVEFDDEKRASLTAITRSSSRLTAFLHNLNIKPNDTYEARTSNIVTTQNELPNGNNPNPSSAFTTNEAQNPESDSFAYLETILESLAILGKLGAALESVTQRLPMELYSLVESTIEEVDERTEFARRLGSGGLNVATGATGGRESVVAAKTGVGYIYVQPKPTASMTMVGNGGPTMGAAEHSPTTLLRLSALENSASNADHEVLRDLFWTLYSKMDAVCQSIRVVYEVANRIGTVCILLSSHK